MVLRYLYGIDDIVDKNPHRLYLLDTSVLLGGYAGWHHSGIDSAKVEAVRANLGFIPLCSRVLVTHEVRDEFRQIVGRMRYKTKNKPTTEESQFISSAKRLANGLSEEKLFSRDVLVAPGCDSPDPISEFIASEFEKHYTMSTPDTTDRHLLSAAFYRTVRDKHSYPVDIFTCDAGIPAALQLVYKELDMIKGISGKRRRIARRKPIRVYMRRKHGNFEPVFCSEKPEGLLIH